MNRVKRQRVQSGALISARPTAKTGCQPYLQSATKPPIKLALITAPVPELTGDRILGLGRGRIRVPRFEDWKDMDREIATLMNDGPMLALEKH